MHSYAKANYFKFNRKLYTHSYCIQLCHKYLQPNWKLSSRLYCNIGIQYCNIDVQVARSTLQSLKSLTSCWSIVTLVFNVLNLSHKHVIYKYFKSFKGYNVCTPTEAQACYITITAKFHDIGFLTY